MNLLLIFRPSPNKDKVLDVELRGDFPRVSWHEPKMSWRTFVQSTGPTHASAKVSSSHSQVINLIAARHKTIAEGKAWQEGMTSNNLISQTRLEPNVAICRLNKMWLAGKRRSGNTYSTSTSMQPGKQDTSRTTPKVQPRNATLFLGKGA